jgi:hypothetical protein
MGRKRDYIESPKFWKDMYMNHSVNGMWTSVDKVPIEKVRIDRSLLAHPNDVDDIEVARILVDFEKEAWTPILVDQDYCLLDGQHRLKVARMLSLKYIDVIVERRSECIRTAPTRSPLAVTSMVGSKPV